MMNFDKVCEIASKISYKDWELRVLKNGPVVLFQTEIQWLFKDGNDNWTSRKWPISIHATTSEVIQTIFKAALTAEEHETREKFLYDGVAVLGPHLDLIAVRDAIEQGKISTDERK